jgi:N-dimethylarginine dimethylaminohydrolase
MKKTLVTLVAVVGLLWGLKFVFGGGSDPAPVAPSRIVTDTGGELREISIHLVPEAAFAHAAWRDFLRGLAGDVDVVVVCENGEAWEKSRELLSGWRIENLARFHPRFLHAALTPWNRDRMIVTDRILFAPPAPHRGGEKRKNEWKVPWVLAGFGRSVEIAPFHFEGGDLIATGTHVFATEVLASRNPTISRDDLGRLIEKVCGRRLVWINGPVPEHHIGMFLTPIDDQTVVVGEAEGEMASALDHVAETLRRKGFRVHRTPLVTTEQEYAWITYNNNVISGKTIFLPTYGIDLDARATALYESLGFRVVPVDVRGLYRLGGTLRCLMHVLRRD